MAGLDLHVEQGRYRRRGALRRGTGASSRRQSAGYSGRWGKSRAHQPARGTAPAGDPARSGREIGVGAVSVSEVEILRGLAEGEQIVVSDTSLFEGAGTVLIR